MLSLHQIHTVVLSTQKWSLSFPSSLDCNHQRNTKGSVELLSRQQHESARRSRQSVTISEGHQSGVDCRDFLSQSSEKKSTQKRFLATDNSVRFAAGSRLARLGVLPTGATASGIHSCELAWGKKKREKHARKISRSIFMSEEWGVWAPLRDGMKKKCEKGVRLPCRFLQASFCGACHSCGRPAVSECRGDLHY